MTSSNRMSTVIAAGQIASALIGFALGTVVTLLAVVHSPSPSLPAHSSPVATTAVPPVVQPPVVQPPTQTATASAPSLAASPTRVVAPEPPVPAPAPQPTAISVAATPADAPRPTATAPENAPVESKPTAKPAKRKPQAPKPSALRARYVVLAGSFISEAIAQKLSDRLTDHDHPADVVVHADETGRVWHVVRLAEEFATHDEAERLSGTLKRREDVDTLVVKLAPIANHVEAAADKSSDKPAAAPP
jgi:hypothetical protein